MRTGVVCLLSVAVVTLFSCGSDDGEVPVISTEQQPSNNVSSMNNGTAGPVGTNNGVVSNNGVPTGTNNGIANNGASNNGNEPTVSTAEEVDANCIDGLYAETLPDPGADISAELSGYSSDQLRQFYDDVLTKRYPTGAHLVEGGLRLFDCVGAFARNTSTAEAAIGSLSTVVHECGHGADLSNGPGTYIITPDLTLSCSVGRATFGRNLLAGDDYHAKRPSCGEGAGEFGCDRYFDVYLSGRGSDQGFDMVLEETTQYVNSLATSYAFQDFIAGRTSALDGILTFLWYLERYLRLARLEHPDDYARLTEPCWREAILTVWGRAWLMIEAAEGNSSLGIDDAHLFDLVRDPDLLGEIQRLRDLEGC